LSFVLLDYSDIQKYDPSGMHKVYDDWPKIAKEAYEFNLEPVQFENIQHIVFSGMGGSGAIGDLFLSVLSKTPIHVTIVKGYVLPKTIDSQTLVIATSVSGNTVETLTTVESAKNIGCKLVCFSSGGKLEQFCKENHIEHRHIPIYGNPRASFPAYVYSILKTLNSIIPITKSNIEESINQLMILSTKISSSNLSESNPSLCLANWLDDVPIIYYPWGLQAAAIRFKNSIQENMKSHAMIEDVIEACHNEIVSWEKKSEIKPILIQGSDDYVKTKERWQILKNFFSNNKIDFWEIHSIEGDVLTKIINLIYLLDFATIYGAVINKVDPFPVKPIDYIKKNL
jgi:glucose/mannose-6-phosphate isomerase